MEHCGIALQEGMLKDELKMFVLLTLFEKGVLQKEPAPESPAEPAAAARSESSFVPVGQSGMLSFQQQRELLTLQLERTKLRVLDSESRLSGELGSVAGREGRDLTASLRLVPKFNERDPDTFFILFERVSETRQWSDGDKVLLLQ